MEAASLTVRRPARLPRVGAGTSDAQLVARIRRGDERAFELVFDRYHTQLLSFCRHMLGTREEAEDALQHVFVSAHRHLVADERAVELRPWLYAIARNRCLSVLRGRRELVALDDVAEPSAAGLAVAGEVEQREDLRELLADLARLPDQQRAALVLSELDALSHDEIAAVLGVRREKVKALVFQARESLGGWREARRTDCSEIREQLASLRGGALRRGPLRKHLDTCASCREFRGEVRRQREAMALLLPVVPTVALKAKVIGAVVSAQAAGHVAAGAGVAGSAGLAGSAAAPVSGGAAMGLGGGVAAKVAVVAVVAGLAGGGYEAAHHGATHAPPAHHAAKARAAAPHSSSAAGLPTPDGVTGVPAGAAGAVGGAKATGLERARTNPGARHRSPRATDALSKATPGRAGSHGHSGATHGKSHQAHGKGGLARGKSGQPHGKSGQAHGKSAAAHTRSAKGHRHHRVARAHAHPARGHAHVRPLRPVHVKPPRPVHPAHPVVPGTSSTAATGSANGQGATKAEPSVQGIVGGLVTHHPHAKP